VLVAEDEARVRSLIRRTLERTRHRVVEACDGAEALARFREDPGGIDLAVLDHSMPKLGGPSALEAMREIRPDLPAILVSGLAAEGAMRRPRTAFLPKPFAPEELADLVARLLGEEEADARDGA
jgi:CheY-like chemotaxis protein